MSERPSIVFFGNPDFALASLEALVEHGFDISLVVASPDKPAGRHLKLKAPETKIYALKKNIPVLQPETLEDATLIQTLQHIKPDLMVVVAFKKLPPEIWAIPTFGTLNVHPSLLPDYRGAAPLQWAIIHGERETGVSIIRINEMMDSGDIVKQIRIPIGDEETFGELYDRMKQLGSALLVETIEAIRTQSALHSIVQKHMSPSKKAPKIQQQDCLLNFHLSALEVFNKIRGLSPYPTAFTYIGREYLKIFSSKIVPTHPPDDYAVGHLWTDFKTYLHIKCGDGKYIALKEVQAANKKRLPIEEFLKGWKPSNLSCLNG